jgi:site-specific DNA recombinase
MAAQVLENEKKERVMRQAVIYTRVSSKDQVDNYSLSSQLTACTAYCEQNDFAIARVFVEEGESAKTADRTELQKLLTFCREREGQVHALVVYNLSRFARDRFDHHALLAHLRTLGVVLRSVTEPVDETPSGELMDAVLAAMHQFENRLRGERTMGGMQSAVREGRWVSRPPLGYLAGEKGHLVHDPERAPLVRWGFERLATGEFTQEEVRRQVHERGLRTPTGRTIYKQTWHKMLRNELYAGRVVNEEWGVDVDACFEPIVSRRTFLRVQEVLAGRRQASSPVASRKLDHPDFPLRRFVRCGGCGGALTAAWSRGRRGGRYGYYFCHKRDCRAVKLRAEALEKEFVEVLRRLQPTKAYLRLLHEEVLAELDRQKKAAREVRRAAQQRVATLQGRKERLVEAYVYEKAIDQKTYRVQLKRLAEQLGSAELACQDATIADIDVDGIFFFAQHVLTDAARLWVEMRPEAKRRFERHLFPDGVVYAPEEGFRTPLSSRLFRPLELPRTPEPKMVEQKGLEPSTPTLRTWCSPS